MPPIVGALLANGLNLLANAVLAKGKMFISEKTGIDLDKTNLTPTDLAALKKYEAEHEEELLKLRLEENKLDLEQIKAYLADTQGARIKERNIATSEQAPWITKVATTFIAFSTILLTFFIFYKVIFHATLQSNTQQKEIILYILGALSAISTQIFSYYFGSSTGSADKSKTIDALLGGKK